MEFIGMIENAFSYLFSDNNKLIKLAAPNIAVGFLGAIISILTLFAGYSDYYYYYDNPIFMVIGILSFIVMILGIIAMILDYGIAMGVTKNTVGGNHVLPEFDLSTFFVDGLKLLVVCLVYLIVPIIIFALFVGLGASTESPALILIGIIILFILSFIISLILPAALGRLAETDSLGEALSFGNIWGITSTIGFVDIFIMLIISFFITGVISGITTFLALIPVIGSLIGVIIGTLLMIFMARIYGLIYLERYNTTQNYNPQYQQPPNNQMNYQQPPAYQQNNQNYQQPPNQQNYQQPNNQMNYQQPPNQQNTQLDYNQNNIQQNNQSAPNTKVCPVCGHQNPGTANQCMNCGNFMQ